MFMGSPWDVVSQFPNPLCGYGRICREFLDMSTCQKPISPTKKLRVLLAFKFGSELLSKKVSVTNVLHTPEGYPTLQAGCTKNLGCHKEEVKISSCTGPPLYSLGHYTKAIKSLVKASRASIYQQKKKKKKSSWDFYFIYNIIMKASDCIKLNTI